MNGNAKWIQWIIGGLMLLAMAVSSYAVARIDTLNKEKLDKEQYYKDIGEMRTEIKCIYNWHLPQELRK